jgi:N-methylhydantoinase A
MRYVLGVDIGGTFTDFSLVSEKGDITLWKEATTPKDPAQAVQQGLNSLAAGQGLALQEFLAQLDLFVHGSTIATNTVIQRNGPKTALICTEGFRDVVYFRDGFKPERYNLRLPRSADFVPRYLRLPVKERVNYKGEVLVPLDESTVPQVVASLKEEGVQSVAVALLWSIMNPQHEQRVKALIEKALPDVPVVLSSDVLPMIREWERTCSTVLSAYILPGISRYMVELERFLHDNHFRHPLLIMQLNGGCSTVDKVLRRPIYALASGPAAGPMAGLYCAEREGIRDVITVDMGGTSFDVCLVSNGTPTLTKELRVEEMPVGVAAVDVHSIGAGGGSVAWIDKGGALQVGPQSAGAEPGPACYGLGGDQPTVTDANVVLGYINPDFFLGGRRHINPELSHKVIVEKVATPLNLSVPEAAQGIFRIVNSNMVNAIRVVSIERGIDPRGYALVVGGGAGAIHAGMLAAELGIKKTLIPRYAGVFCSYGMVVSDVKHDYMKAFATNTAAFDLDGVNAIYADLEQQALAELQEEGFPASAVSISRFADAKYPNQIHELTIPLPSQGSLTKGDILQVAETFHALHERMFTYCVRESSVDLFHWRITAVGKIPSLRVQEYARTRKSAAIARKTQREVYFSTLQGYVPTDIYDGSKLTHGMMVRGPAVVEQENTTIVVFPEQTLRVNRFGDYILSL